MIWLLKNNISINWPHHIMQHMLKCKASDTPLPYGVLITQIMQYSGVDFSLDANTTIGKRQHFSTRSLKRLILLMSMVYDIMIVQIMMMKGKHNHKIMCMTT